jgi:hypothetical protein
MKKNESQQMTSFCNFSKVFVQYVEMEHFRMN